MVEEKNCFYFKIDLTAVKMAVESEMVILLTPLSKESLQSHDFSHYLRLSIGHLLSQTHNFNEVIHIIKPHATIKSSKFTLVDSQL